MAGKITVANAASVVEVARWGKGPANSVRFSPDGSILAVSSPIGVYFYDPATLQEIRHIDTQATAGDLAFSPDGKSIAVVVDRHELNLYDVEGGQELRTFSGHEAGVNCVAFSPDGKTLAYGLSDMTAVVADFASGSELHTLKGHSNSVTTVVFMPDGKTLATAAKDTSIILWDVSSGNQIRTIGGGLEMVGGNPYDIMDVAVSPDGKTLASTFGANSLTLWDPMTGQALHSLVDNLASFGSLAFSPDGKTLAVAPGYAALWLIDVNTGKKTRTFTGNQSLSSIHFSPDGQTLAVVVNLGTVEVLDAHSGKVIRAPEGHIGPVSALALSADGKALVAAYGVYGEGKRTFIAYNISDGVSHDLGPSSCYPPFALSPDGRTVASKCLPQGSNNNEVGLIEVDGGSPPRILTAQPFETGVDLGALAFSPDGRTLALGMDQDYIGAPQIRFLSVAGGGSRNSQAPWTIPVASLAFSPDGKWLAQGPVQMVQSEGGPPVETKVSVWDVATAKEILGLAGYKDSVVSLVFSPDGKTLATGSNEDGRIRIWALPGGQEIHDLERAGFAIHLAYSPDGGLLIAGTSDGKITLWDTSTWAPVATLSGHTGAVTGVAFTPDGQSIVSGSEDGTIRFWAIQR
jgi:WD40 repeat protein